MTTASLQEHYKNLMAEWTADAISHEQPRDSFFLDFACSLLADQGYNLEDFIPAYYITETANGNRYHLVDGYSYNESENILTLVVCDFSESDELQRMSKGDFDSHFKRIARFYSDVKRGKYDCVEPGREIFALIQLIKQGPFHEERGGMYLHLITNKECSFDPPEKRVLSNGCSILYQVSDFLAISEAKPQPLVLDFSKFEGKPYSAGLPFLLATDKENVDFFQSYLLVMPAEALVQCYDTFRARILERNVRVYLQKRGKVNQGIHETISKEPDVFFVYNNGLAITADSVDVSADGMRIEKIHGLQVVNGGQTMACLHHAWKEKKNVSNISVQVKLTVLPKRITDVIVPYISRYSNSQNAVKDTDQHSNDFVQICIEQQSRKNKTPGPIPTTWFYERMRGQYANAQLHMRKTEQQAFQKKNPKKQVVQPVALSQAVMTFEMMPYLVVRGAQKAYNGVGNIKGFCDYTSALWITMPEYIGSAEWYKESMGKYILFKSAKDTIVKNIVVSECEQLKSFSASIATYTISTLVFLLWKKGMSINCMRIWEKQGLDDSIIQNLQNVARCLLQKISTRADHSEWLKKLDTWEILKQHAENACLTLHTESGYYACKKPLLMTDLTSVRERQDDFSPAQIKVMCVLPDVYWNALDSWVGNTNQELPETTSKYLNKRCLNHKLSDKQCKELLEYSITAIKKGWTPPIDPQRKIIVDKPQISSALGNPVRAFFEEGLGDILVLDRTIDLNGGSIFLPDLFAEAPQIAQEEKAKVGSSKPELGSFLAFDVGRGRKVVLAYNKKTKDSVCYLPIWEVCLKAIAAEYGNRSIVMSHVDSEGASPKDSLRRKDVMAIVYKILYAHEVVVMSLPMGKIQEN